MKKVIFVMSLIFGLFSFTAKAQSNTNNQTKTEARAPVEAGKRVNTCDKRANNAGKNARKSGASKQVASAKKDNTFYDCMKNAPIKKKGN